VDAQGKPIANMMTPVQFQDYMIQNPDLTKSLLERNIFEPIRTTQPATGPTTMPPQVNGVPFNPNLPQTSYWSNASMNPFDIYGR
jgi:hypothetical protein